MLIPYIHTYMHAYIHTYIHTCIHTCLYLPIYVGVGTYILHPTHPTGGGGEAEVPCMIVGFQGGSTPNPRNHPHRGGGRGCRPVPYIYIFIIIFANYVPLSLSPPCMYQEFPHPPRCFLHAAGVARRSSRRVSRISRGNGRVKKKWHTSGNGIRTHPLGTLGALGILRLQWKVFLM